PLAVREGDHPVLATLPERNRDGDLAQREAPIPGEREVIIEPAPDAVRDRSASRREQRVGERTRERGAVDVGEQPTDRVDQVLWRRRGTDRSGLLGQEALELRRSG